MRPLAHVGSSAGALRAATRTAAARVADATAVLLAMIAAGAAPVLAQSPPAGAVTPAGGSGVAAASGARILCSDNPGPVALGSAQWNGWGRGVENTRYQPEPAIRATDVSRLALKWAFGYPGASSVSGQPTIVDGRVFVAGGGAIYALDAKSGCTYWRFDADAHAFSPMALVELGTPRAVFKPKPKRRRGRHQRIDAHLDVVKAPSAVFFGDDKGAIYALDAERGTLLWKTQLETQPSARILGAPAVYQNRLYVAVGSSEPTAARNAAYACCTFRGSVAALDIATGRVAWKTYLVPEEPRAVAGAGGAQRSGPAGVAVEAAPTIDTVRGLAYVSTGDSFNPSLQPTADAVVALSLLDGQIRWSKQLEAPPFEAGSAGAGVAGAAGAVGAASGAGAHGMGVTGTADLAGAAPRDFSASPILRTLASGRQMLFVGQRSGMVYSLDPERSGEVIWQYRALDTRAPDIKTPGGIDFGMAADHHSLYAAVSGLLAEPPNLAGSLVAIDMKAGTKRWQTTTPPVACSWSSATVCAHGLSQAVTVIPGAAFAGSMDGHLRAYSTIDGKILWDYDTAKEFVTVNHVKAGGGALDRGGATIVNGVVYVNSGSERGGPGNVLLAFTVDGK